MQRKFGQRLASPIGELFDLVRKGVQQKQQPDDKDGKHQAAATWSITHRSWPARTASQHGRRRSCWSRGRTRPTLPLQRCAVPPYQEDELWLPIPIPPDGGQEHQGKGRQNFLGQQTYALPCALLHVRQAHGALHLRLMKQLALRRCCENLASNRPPQ